MNHSMSDSRPIFYGVSKLPNASNAAKAPEVKTVSEGSHANVRQTGHSLYSSPCAGLLGLVSDHNVTTTISNILQGLEANC